MRAKAFAAVAAAIVVVLGTCAAAGAQPASRHPGPAYKTLKAETTASFRLGGTNGYLVGVTLHDRHRLSLTALPTSGRSFGSTSYTLTVPQKPGSDEIKGRLGRLGSIDVRFVAESSHLEEPFLPSCKGRRATLEEGRFVGQIHFHGEDGYTRVEAGRAFGTVKTRPKLRCNLNAVKAELNKLFEELGGENGKEEEKGPREAEEPEPEVHLVALKVKARRIGFQASRISTREPGKKGASFTSFSAHAERHRGRIDEVASTTLLFEAGSAFKVPDIAHLTREGVIEPPAPFSGSATYRRESPHSLSWTGDLSVTLPGFGLVPLAGRTTSATLCADEGCRH